MVKTNITALFDKIQPRKIHIVSPVMHVDSASKLLNEFPKTYSGIFDFEYLAKDRDRDNKTGEVRPGVVAMFMSGSVLQANRTKTGTGQNSSNP